MCLVEIGLLGHHLLSTIPLSPTGPYVILFVAVSGYPVAADNWRDRIVRLSAPDSKSGMPQGIGGSNPSPSANQQLAVSYQQSASCCQPNS